MPRARDVLTVRPTATVPHLPLEVVEQAEAVYQASKRGGRCLACGCEFERLWTRSDVARYLGISRFSVGKLPIPYVDLEYRGKNVPTTMRGRRWRPEDVRRFKQAADARALGAVTR